MKRSITLAIILLIPVLSFAQHTYIKRCEGVWTGKMRMYSWNQLRDSVDVRLTIAPQAVAETWTWKTEYLSPKRPMTKDYVLRVKDRTKNIYVTDEGEGVELTTYLNGTKLYNVFETAGTVLTATYECTGTQIIFEVTSGKAEPATHPEIKNYSVDHLQRAVLTKQ